MAERETIIKLNSQTDAMVFCTAALKNAGDITLVSGRYIVDGKSIMGILSLDMQKPIKMIAEDPSIEFATAISDFIVQ